MKRCHFLFLSVLHILTFTFPHSFLPLSSMLCWLLLIHFISFSSSPYSVQCTVLYTTLLRTAETESLIMRKAFLLCSTVVYEWERERARVSALDISRSVASSEMTVEEGPSPQMEREVRASNCNVLVLHRTRAKYGKWVQKSVWKAISYSWRERVKYSFSSKIYWRIKPTSKKDFRSRVLTYLYA